MCVIPLDVDVVYRILLDKLPSPARDTVRDESSHRIYSPQLRHVEFIRVASSVG